MIRRLVLSAGVAAVLAGVPAFAGHPAGATAEDLRDLQYDIELLDDTLAAVPAGHAREAEFRQRADEIRDEATWLKVQVRRHQQNRGAGLGATADDVDRLRRMVLDLQEDLDVALNRRFTGQASLPTGTEILVRLDQPLSSDTARLEDRVEASVAESVLSNGRVVIPTGTRVRGIVTRVERAERPARGGKLDLTFDTIYLDDRTGTALRTSVVSLRPGIDRSETAQRAGIGAVLGGVLGSILGGRKATVIGAILGAGGGIAASEGEEVNLPEGTIMTVRLDQPLAVRR